MKTLIEKKIPWIVCQTSAEKQPVLIRGAGLISDIGLLGRQMKVDSSQAGLRYIGG
ncbi:MAG: hypothetical protein QXI11_07760 [Thermoproteota archaeon]